MTKTQFKNLAIEQMRNELLEIFEDPEGSIAIATKSQLRDFVDENWDYIDQVYNSQEEADAEEEEVEEQEASEEASDEGIEEDDPEPEEEQVLTSINLKTDLYSGAPPT